LATLSVFNIRTKNGKRKEVGQAETSNLSKAHETRDSSGPATLAISVGLQQEVNNAS